MTKSRCKHLHEDGMTRCNRRYGHRGLHAYRDGTSVRRWINHSERRR